MTVASRKVRGRVIVATASLIAALGLAATPAVAATTRPHKVNVVAATAIEYGVSVQSAPAA